MLYYNIQTLRIPIHGYQFQTAQLKQLARRTLVRRKPIRIHTEKFHNHPHCDEISAKSVNDLVGQRDFPGSANAKRAYTANPQGEDGAADLGRGILPYGNGGDIFDEHRRNARKDYVMNPVCCTDLVVAYHDVRDEALLSYAALVHHCDTTNEVGPFWIPSVIKEWNRALAEDEVFLRSTRAVNDLIKLAYGQQKWARGGARFTVAELGKSLDVILAGADLRKHGVRRLLKYIKKFEERENPHPMELAVLLRDRGLLYSPQMRAIPRQWNEAILKDCVAAAQKFDNSFDSFDKGSFERFFIKGTNVRVKWSMHNTADPNILKIAGGWYNGDITVIHHPTKGQVQIFTRSRNTVTGERRPYIDLAGVAAMVRKQELMIRGLSHLVHAKPEEHWRQPGTVEECKWWHYQVSKNAHQLMNGSQDAGAGVEGTAISREAIRRIILEETRLTTGYVWAKKQTDEEGYDLDLDDDDVSDQQLLLLVGDMIGDPNCRPVVNNAGEEGEIIEGIVIGHGSNQKLLGMGSSAY
jgi:hypothetical protein